MDKGKFRIAIFSLAYPPFVGGAELAVKEVAARIPEFKFICLTHKFSSDWSNHEQVGNVDVRRLGKGTRLRGEDKFYGNKFSKFLYIFRAWRAAEAIHRNERFDAIWGIMAAYGGAAALLFKMRHPKIPFLLSLQEGDTETHILRRVGWWRLLWRLMFKRADRIHAISSFLKDFALRQGAVNPVDIVPNGINVERFKENSKRPGSHDICRIITTSRLVHKNGIDVLMRAVARIQHMKWELHILGAGPLEGELASLAKKLHIHERVKFFGHIAPHDVPAYLESADIFVRPSRSEGLGSSFLEAMGAGLPIIGTPVGGITDFLRDYEKEGDTVGNGLFSAVDDDYDLSVKISFLMEHPKIANMLGRNGKKFVLRHYSWNDIAFRMKTIFQEII
jgi:glycosyltransferase involved in cell wall biosynthesis